MASYDLYDSPGLGAFFAGQRRAEERAATLSNLMTAHLNRQNLLQQMFQESQMFPERLKQMQMMSKINEGKITEEENRRRREATDRFFEYMQKYDDPQGAVEYSGVPPKFAERFLSLTPEQRQQVYKSWTENQQRPQKEMETFKSKLRQQETEASKKADFARAKMQEEERTKRALEVARLRAETLAAQAAQKVASVKNMNYQQYATSLMQQIMEAKAMPETTPEEKEAKYRRIEELSQQLDVVVQQDLQARAFSVQQRQAGAPDIGALGGGQIPTVPQPTPQLPGQQLAQPPQPQGQPPTQPKAQGFVNFKGKRYEVLKVNPDGSLSIRDPQTGLVGTLSR